MQEILYQTTNQDLSSYENLVNLYAKYITRKNEKIEIRLEGWFDANLSAVLGGICEKLLDKHKISLKCGKYKIKEILERNGFYEAHLGGEKCTDVNHSTIPYLNIPVKKEFDFATYLQTNLLSHERMPKLLDNAKKAIQQSILEVISNVKLHSHSQKFYTCGQYFYKKHKFAFCIVDTGIGFAESIKQKFNQNLTSQQAIEWAIQEGNTTKSVTGGLGLSLIREFIEANQGELYIISGNAILCIKDGRKEYKILENFFDGVIVNMVFKTDENKKYGLKSDFEKS